MWYVGISTAFLSSISGGLGDNLIRLSYILEDELQESKRRPVFLRPIWLTGMFLSCILNAVLIIVSLNYTSAMVVTPFSGLHIFWSILFSRYILNEETKKRHYKGTFIVIIGLLFIVLFGIRDVPAYTINELEKLYTNPVFVIYCIMNILLILVCMYVSFFGVVKDFANNMQKVVDAQDALGSNQRNDRQSCDNVGSGKDEVIIVNKNALHLKISNIKSIILKNKHEQSEVSSYNKVLEDFYNKEDNTMLEYNMCKSSDAYESDVSNCTDFEKANDGSLIEQNQSVCAQGWCKSQKEKVLNFIVHLDNTIEHIRETLRRKTDNCPRIYVKLSLKRFCMCLVSGLCGGYTNVLVQNLINITLLNGWKIMLHLMFYYLIAMIFMLTCIQWLFWNSCLFLYQAIYVVPIINSVLIASSGFCNLILYYHLMNDYTGAEGGVKSFIVINNYSNLNQIYFLTGQFLIIVGIYIISSKNMETLGDSLLFLTRIKSKFEEFDHLKDYIRLKNKQINSSLESLLGFYNRNINVSAKDSQVGVFSQELVTNTGENNRKYSSGCVTCIDLDKCTIDYSYDEYSNATSYKDDLDDTGVSYIDNTIVLPQEMADQNKNIDIYKDFGGDYHYEGNQSDVKTEKSDYYYSSSYSTGDSYRRNCDCNPERGEIAQQSGDSPYVLDDYSLREDEHGDYYKITENNNDFLENNMIVEELEIHSEVELDTEDKKYKCGSDYVQRDKTSISTIDTTNSGVFCQSNAHI